MNLLKNKYFILGNILLLLAVIPLTLFVVKRQTNLRSKAAPSTILSFTPATASIPAGQTTSFNIMVNPGQNVVSIIEVTIQVDPDKLEIVSLTNNDIAFPAKLRGPTINADGTASLSTSTSNDIQKAIQAPTKVATLVLKAKTSTGGAASIVRLDKLKSQVFSLATADGATENVLSDVSSASITITGSASSSSGSKPICTALTLNKSTSGTAPYSITYTGTGTSANGTISRATFSFGDGTSQEITSTGGIGTNSVNIQIAHTYTIPGSYSANVIFTDNTGNTSDPAVCTKAITIGTSGTTVTPAATGAITPTTIPTTAPTAIPTITPTTIPTAIPTAKPIVNNPTPTLPVTGTIATTFAVLGGVGVALAIGLFLFIL